MNVFTDGLTVLVNQAWTVFSVFITVIWGQVLIITLFKKIFKTQMTNSDYMSLGLAGWILPVILLSVLAFVGKFLFGEIAAIIISVFAVMAMVWVLFVGKLERISLLTSLLFFVAFSVFLILQLAFLKNMILPSYFDSAEHYRIIKAVSEYDASSSSGFPITNYYHVGFHLLSATLSNVFHLGIVDIMLVFGQVILAVLPFSLFFIIKRETASNVAAVFTCLLAGVGWHMPSHVVDWGKYPALFSLVGIHFVLCIAYLIYQNNQTKAERIALYGLLAFGVLTSVFLHTRSLIIFSFMGVSLLLTARWKRLPLLFQRIVVALVVLLIAAEIIAVQSTSVLPLLFETYVRRDMVATGLILFLLIFSVWAFPDLTFFLLLLFSLTIAGLFIPVTGFMGYGALTLLDRPYVQMLLYLPLSIFGGLGMAGLNQFLQKFSRPIISAQLTILLVFGLLVLNVKANHSFYPSDCCQIASHDDLSAIHWMDKALSPDANVLIASANLFVTSLESPDALAGMDGGIWVTPLISRTTIPMRSDLNFDQPEIHAEICQKKIGHIYAGGTSQSFNALQLDGHAEWYQIVFSLPAAKVYRVDGCK